MMELLEIPPRRCIIGTEYWRLESGVRVSFLCLFQYGITQDQSVCSSILISAGFTTIYQPLILDFRTVVDEETW